MSSKECFTAQIEYFSKFYKVTALDFIGFGQSGKLTAPFSVSDYADWTRKAIDGLGLKRPSVIAHSFGCRVALKMSDADGACFEKMILTGPAGVILRRGIKYKIKVKTYRIVKKFAPKFAERRFGSAEYRALSPVMKESYKKIVNEDLLGVASRVQTPVLIIQGKADKTTPIEEARAYLEVLPNGKLEIIEGGHFAFAENPLSFNLTAEEFLL